VFDNSEVQDDVAQQFLKYPACILKKDDKIFIDLGAVIQQQLLDVGLSTQNIELDPTCTYCDQENYFSFRRDNPQKLEVMVAYIKLNT
jgi:copper oxidase (laccase) domain-containing protein